MTLAQLRAFLESYISLSFTAAAKSIGISQASVSELVSRLEDELTVKLFYREPRGLRPTQDARKLFPFAESILQLAQDAVTSVRNPAQLLSGSAQFGVPRNARFYGLDDFAVSFYTDFPAVQLRLIGVNSSLVAQDIAKGEIEAGLVVLPVRVDGLNVEPIAKDTVLAALPEAYHEPTIDLETFASYPVVLYDAHAGWEDPTRKQLYDLCQEAGVALEPIIEVEQVDVALKLVAKGAGASIVSASLVRAQQVPDGVRVVPFATPMFETLAIISRQGKILSPATAEIVRRVKQSVWSSFEDH